MSVSNFPPQFVVSAACQFSLDALITVRKACDTNGNGNTTIVNSCLCDTLDPESTLAYCNFDYNKRERWASDHTQAVASRLDACQQVNKPVVPHKTVIALPQGVPNPLALPLFFSGYFHDTTCNPTNAYAYSLKALPGCYNWNGDCLLIGGKANNRSRNQSMRQGRLQLQPRNHHSFRYFAIALGKSLTSLNLDAVDGWKPDGNQINRGADKISLVDRSGNTFKTVAFGECVSSAAGSYIFAASGGSAATATSYWNCCKDHCFCSS
ncbi:hypothetical protein BDR26DRAFT_925877 [Obelidium mucronatum]|nr:hypothetical protein BDR26DRAFT_925877 [Obelidium mucronatum]